MPFDPFGDYATRGYLRNVAGEKDPDLVKRLEHRTFAANVTNALEALTAVPQLRYEHVLATNRTLFSTLYPWAGQDRAALAPDLAIGKAGRYHLFAHPHDAKRAVEYGLDRGHDPRAMHSRPGEVLGRLAYAHAFVETNGRTIMTIHADMSRRAGFHIAWHDITKADFLTALTAELRQPGSALDQLLAKHIRAGPMELRSAATQLATNPGLNPAGTSNPPPTQGPAPSPGM